jgi:hypothetical protein
LAVHSSFQGSLARPSNGEFRPAWPQPVGLAAVVDLVAVVAEDPGGADPAARLAHDVERIPVVRPFRPAHVQVHAPHHVGLRENLANRVVEAP